MNNTTVLDSTTDPINYTNSVRVKQRLYKYNFSGKSCVNTQFVECYMVGADFRNSDLTSAVFENCDLTGADFRGATIEGAIFKNCDLTKVNVENLKSLSSLDGVTFNACKGAFTEVFNSGFSISFLIAIGGHLYINGYFIGANGDIWEYANDYNLDHLKHFSSRLEDRLASSLPCDNLKSAYQTLKTFIDSHESR